MMTPRLTETALEKIVRIGMDRIDQTTNEAVAKLDALKEEISSKNSVLDEMFSHYRILCIGQHDYRYYLREGYERILLRRALCELAPRRLHSVELCNALSDRPNPFGPIKYRSARTSSFSNTSLAIGAASVVL